MSIDKAAVRKKLEAQREALELRMTGLSTAGRDETAAGSDVSGGTDNAHEWENSEIIEGQVQEAQDELRQIEAAFASLEAGTYGLCSVCGNPIGDARLERVPETVYCIEHAP